LSNAEGTYNLINISVFLRFHLRKQHAKQKSATDYAYRQIISLIAHGFQTQYVTAPRNGHRYRLTVDEPLFEKWGGLTNKEI
jgi:hypothetical protein